MSLKTITKQGDHWLDAGPNHMVKIIDDTTGRSGKWLVIVTDRRHNIVLDAGQFATEGEADSKAQQLRSSFMNKSFKQTWKEKNQVNKASITADNFKAFKRAYEKAKSEDQTQFVFEGQTVLVSYAKYVVELGESRFKKAQGFEVVQIWNSGARDSAGTYSSPEVAERQAKHIFRTSKDLGLSGVAVLNSEGDSVFTVGNVNKSMKEKSFKDNWKQMVKGEVDVLARDVRVGDHISECGRVLSIMKRPDTGELQFKCQYDYYMAKEDELVLIDKAMDTSFAGDTPNSLLARQDLEGEEEQFSYRYSKDTLQSLKRELSRMKGSWNGEDRTGTFEGAAIRWEEAIDDLEDQIRNMEREGIGKGAEYMSLEQAKQIIALDAKGERDDDLLTATHYAPSPEGQAEALGTARTKLKEAGLAKADGGIIQQAKMRGEKLADEGWERTDNAKQLLTEFPSLTFEEYTGILNEIYQSKTYKSPQKDFKDLWKSRINKTHTPGQPFDPIHMDEDIYNDDDEFFPGKKIVDLSKGNVVARIKKMTAEELLLMMTEENEKIRDEIERLGGDVGHLEAKSFKQLWKRMSDSEMRNLIQEAMRHVDEGMGTQWPRYVGQFLQGKGASPDEIELIIDSMNEEFEHLGR